MSWQKEKADGQTDRRKDRQIGRETQINTYYFKRMNISMNDSLY